MVDYPVQIPPGSETLRGRCRGEFAGPYFPGGSAIYTFLIQTTTGPDAGHMEVWKSLDQGATWQQLDTSNDPDVNALALLSLDSQAAFDLNVIPRIYVLYLDTSGNLRVHPFNTQQDRWLTVSSAGPAAAGPNFRTGMTRRPVAVNGIEFPIAYKGADDNVGGTDYNRVYYTVYRPATDTWDTGVRLFGGSAEAEHFVQKSRAEGQVVRAGQGRVHFFARKGASDFSAGIRIVHRSVAGDDTISAQENVTADTGVPRVGLALSGPEIVLPFRQGIGSPPFNPVNVRVARAVSGASMTWVIEDVYSETDVDNAVIQAEVLGVVKLSGLSLRTYFAIDPLGANQAVILYSSDDGGSGTWAARVQLHSFSDATAAVIRSISVAAQGNAIGNVFDLELGADPDQAHYTQDGVLGPGAGMINQVETISGGGYVVS